MEVRIKRQPGKPETQHLQWVIHTGHLWGSPWKHTPCSAYSFQRKNDSALTYLWDVDHLNKLLSCFVNFQAHTAGVLAYKWYHFKNECELSQEDMVTSPGMVEKRPGEPHIERQHKPQPFLGQPLGSWGVLDLAGSLSLRKSIRNLNQGKHDCVIG